MSFVLFFVKPQGCHTCFVPFPLQFWAGQIPQRFLIRICMTHAQDARPKCFPHKHKSQPKVFHIIQPLCWCKPVIRVIRSIQWQLGSWVQFISSTVFWRPIATQKQFHRTFGPKMNQLWNGRVPSPFNFYAKHWFLTSHRFWSFSPSTQRSFIINIIVLFLYMCLCVCVGILSLYNMLPCNCWHNIILRLQIKAFCEIQFGTTILYYSRFLLVPINIKYIWNSILTGCAILYRYSGVYIVFMVHVFVASMKTKKNNIFDWHEIAFRPKQCCIFLDSCVVKKYQNILRG